MDNPVGGITRGWSEIRAIYEKILSGNGAVTVEFHAYTIHESGGMFYAVGQRGLFRSNAVELKLAVCTRRIFKMIDGRWPQVHHHGSFDDPELLASYQSLILGRRKTLA